MIKLSSLASRRHFHAGRGSRSSCPFLHGERHLLLVEEVVLSQHTQQPYWDAGDEK